MWHGRIFGRLIRFGPANRALVGFMGSALSPGQGHRSALRGVVGATTLRHLLVPRAAPSAAAGAARERGDRKNTRDLPVGGGIAGRFTWLPMDGGGLPKKGSYNR